MGVPIRNPQSAIFNQKGLRCRASGVRGKRSPACNEAPAGKPQRKRGDRLWKSGSWIDGFGGFSICNLQWRQSSITRPSELHRFATKTPPGCHRKTTILPPKYHRFRHAGEGLRMPDLPFYQGVVREEPGTEIAARKGRGACQRHAGRSGVPALQSSILNLQSPIKRSAYRRIDALLHDLSYPITFYQAP